MEAETGRKYANKSAEQNVVAPTELQSWFRLMVLFPNDAPPPQERTATTNTAAALHFARPRRMNSPGRTLERNLARP
jgi:hypothetical protein